MSEEKFISDEVYPIRLMFGIGNNMIQGFSVVYENSNSSAEWVNIWSHEEEFSKIRFTDKGDSRIVFNTVTRGGLLGPRKVNVIREIVIRRDAQFPHTQ